MSSPWCRLPCTWCRLLCCGRHTIALRSLRVGPAVEVQACVLPHCRSSDADCLCADFVRSCGQSHPCWPDRELGPHGEVRVYFVCHDLPLSLSHPVPFAIQSPIPSPIPVPTPPLIPSLIPSPIPSPISPPISHPISHSSSHPISCLVPPRLAPLHP